MSNLQSEGVLQGIIDSYSDTIDYNNLTNKPKINGTTIEGDHDGHYYGLANLSDIKTEIEWITWSDYKQLSEARKKDGTVYFIPDCTAWDKGTASGSVVTFNDGSENPLVDLKLDINAVQSGTGTPSPSNPRTISGWTSANVVVSPTLDPGDGTTYNINWNTEAGEIFGGKLDATTGVLTVDKTFVEFDGSSDENWIMGSSGGHYRAYINISDIKSYSGSYSSISTLYICSIFENASWNSVFDGNLKAGMTGQNWGFGLDALSITTDSALRSWISSNHIQVCYELANPITVTLTPEQISTILGTNNIWANTGDVDLEYWKNTGSRPEIRCKDIIFGIGI